MRQWPTSWEYRFVRHRDNTSGGFSLLELLMSLGIVSILLSLVVSSYHVFLQRGDRQAMQTSLLQLVSEINQLRLGHMTGDLVVELDPNQLMSRTIEDYEVRIVPNPIGRSAAYWVAAEPKAATRQAKDGALSINHLGQGCWHKGQSTVVDSECSGEVW